MINGAIMKILYVSTFNKKIFIASGRKMLDSFFTTQKNGDILCCYEEINPERNIKYINNKRFKHYDLGTSKFLNGWLEENKDYIPVEYGGLATKEKKPQAFLKWNFRAAGWFRKIASLAYAQNFVKNYDALIFVDSDSKFLKNITVFDEVFQDCDYFYHWGDERKKKDLGVESGFIGFKNTEKGLYTLNYWIDKFRDKQFRRYMRWDDGGMFSNVLHELNFQYGKDLVVDYKDKGKSQSHVIERGIFAEYIIHDKGLHQKLGLTNEVK